MKKSHRVFIISTLIVLLLAAGGEFTELESRSTDYYSEVRRNILLFGEIYKEVTNRYVEEIDPEKFMRAGIQGMLDRLDPYTTYLEDDARDDVEIMTRGKYYGVGMRIQQRNGWATVSEQPFPNSPAFRAGIREGDQIIEIDGNSTEGQELSETARQLRGPEKGSAVVIKIRRVGEDKPLTFRLIRDEIIVSDIEYAGFVEPGVGLIKLSRFNRTADRQIGEALERLLNEEMEALILDLRGDPGGLLDVAVAVADHFIEKDELIVYTKGRWENNNQEYRAQGHPIAGNIPLVVLVDELSASASEIVAGAIQDLDRGVIMGTDTFGKGLVQTVLPLDRRGENQLKLTTAKYYIPSGRTIQRPEAFKRGPNSVFPPAPGAETGDEPSDSEFRTRRGRPVEGGGGIKPDIAIEDSTFRATPYVRELMRHSMFFNFSLEYVTEHSDLARDFEVTGEMIEAFKVFVQQKDFEFEPPGYAEFKELEKISREREYYSAISAPLDSIRSAFQAVAAREIEESGEQISMLIRREIARKLFGSDASYEVMFSSDSTLMAAVELLQDPEQYRRILNIETAPE